MSSFRADRVPAGAVSVGEGTAAHIIRPPRGSTEDSELLELLQLVFVPNRAVGTGSPSRRGPGEPHGSPVIKPDLQSFTAEFAPQAPRRGVGRSLRWLYRLTQPNRLPGPGARLKLSGNEGGLAETVASLRPAQP